MSTEKIPEIEYEKLKNDLDKFGELWVMHVSKNNTPKLDILIFCVPKVISSMEGHCGSLSEQNIERIHLKRNLQAGKTHNIANNIERTKYIHQVRIIFKAKHFYNYGRSVRLEQIAFFVN